MLNSLLWIIPLVLAVSAKAAPSLSEVTNVTRELAGPDEKHPKPVTLEDVIGELGKRYPELRDNFVLMHDSRSRQYASYEFPRVISHATNGQFTMAFNGEAGQKGYDELEMFEFNAVKDEFRFQRIQFRRGRADVKEVNESRCLGCHGRDPRPNWESYNVWPGAYPRTDHHQVGEKYNFEWKGVDHAGFDSFYTNQNGKGRYAFLNPAAVDSQFVVGKYSKEYRRARPSHYTQLVGPMNYRRVARLLRATPDFDKYQYAIAAALYDCPNIEAYLPKDYAPKQTYEWYLADTAKEFHGDVNHYHFEHDEGTFAKFRFVIEGRGISMAQWSTNFRGTPYAFVTPGGDPSGFILGYLMEKDDALKPYRVWNIVEDKDYGVTTAFTHPWTGNTEVQNRPACEGLLRKSQEAY